VAVPPENFIPKPETQLTSVIGRYGRRIVWRWLNAVMAWSRGGLVISLPG